MADQGEDVTGRAGSSAPAAGGEQSFERARTILAELVDAVRSVAEAMLDDQKQQAAERVAGIAEAVRSAAQSLDRSEHGSIARYADGAADQVDHVSQLIRDRHWSEIVADTEDFAQRRPMLFALGATAAGFLAGRLLSVPSGRQQRGTMPQAADLSPHRGETDEITAAVSKLATQPSGGDAEASGHDAEFAAGPETR
jgi:ElaB/YqjD/DUF883 family membrane-anchored ribosome-binding protein